MAEWGQRTEAVREHARHQPITAAFARHLLDRAFRALGRVRPKRFGFHPLRRKFASCRLYGAVGPNALDCYFRAITSASVVRQPLTNPVYLRRDVFWEKEGNSQVYVNSADVQISQSFSRTWKVGTEEVQTEEFGRSVSATLGAEKGPLKASVTGTLEQTFGSSITITDAVETTETYSVTVAGSTTAVFEVWNLVERYTFANADSTPYADPNYRFAEADLTRRATITTAFVSTEFPND